MIKDSLVIDFGDETEENECEFKLKIEIKDNPCKSEAQVKIRVLGKDIEYLNNIELYAEENKLSNAVFNISNETEIENITFDDSIYSKTTYTIGQINSAVAATSLLEIITQDKQSIINVKYSSGSNVYLVKEGDICVKVSEILTQSEAASYSPLYGSVDITYQAHKIYKEYTWKAPLVESETELSVPFFVFYQGGKVENFNIVVQPKYQPIDIKFTIKDIQNESIIPNARVHITNIALGYSEQQTSNEKGECIFTLIPGETYNIETTAEGYINSNQDYINNDSFVVPVPTE